MMKIFIIVFYSILIGLSARSQNYIVDSSFGVNGTMKLLSPDTLNSPIYQYSIDRDRPIAAIHNLFQNWTNQIQMTGAIFQKMLRTHL